MALSCPELFVFTLYLSSLDLDFTFHFDYLLKWQRTKLKVILSIIIICASTMAFIADIKKKKKEE